MKNKKLQVWLPLIFAVVLVMGMFFGFKLHQQTGGSQSFFKEEKHNSIQEALNLIHDRYVDNVNMDSLQDGALSDVMEHLDPHSYYIPSTDVLSANEDLVGNFEGIGIEFNIHKDTVHVQYVVPGGPGEKAGIHFGDKLIKVDSSNVVSKTLSTKSIRNLIRGKGGTVVRLTVLRGNTLQYFNVVRGRIPIPSMEAGYMIAPATGFIKLSKFSESTFREFMTALESLKGKGMKKLILDLRGNPGGYVNQAVDIADEFLPGDKLIVYTRGTNSEEEQYKAKRTGMFEEGKLVVLIDEFSASASEILAGALQDHDRATIIGRRSFGKGLVQEQYGLSDGAAIRLTIARYFTPSGRSIQRPYVKGKKVYMEEVAERYLNGESIQDDSLRYSKGQMFKTDAGKIVYGGGGIAPDIFVAADSDRVAGSISKLYLDGRFNNFVYQYYLAHEAEFARIKSPADFENSFKGKEEAWKDLVTYASKDSINLNNISMDEKQKIQNQIVAYLARLRWRTQGYYEVANGFDPVVRKALEILK